VKSREDRVRPQAGDIIFEFLRGIVIEIILFFLAIMQLIIVWCW